jgi:N-acetylglutamate synthase-like GNAT family acetyltransferase
MSAPYRVRRATLDDIQPLRSLWTTMRFNADELEKRLTEFQVAEDASGTIAGSFGFNLRERHGLIHSEAFENFGLADEVRPLFWQRIQSLAMNHGVARLWTNDPAPFWTRNGFQPPTPEASQKRPSEWHGGTWFTLQLKNEEAIAAADKEVMMLMEAERRRTKSKLESAKTLKNIVTIIAFGVAILMLGAAVYLFFIRQQFPAMPQ